MIVGSSFSTVSVAGVGEGGNAVYKTSIPPGPPPYLLQITAARLVNDCSHMQLMFVAALRLARTLADQLGYVIGRGQARGV